jgi:hypothetical protein
MIDIQERTNLSKHIEHIELLCETIEMHLSYLFSFKDGDTLGEKKTLLCVMSYLMERYSKMLCPDLKDQLNHHFDGVDFLIDSVKTKLESKISNQDCNYARLSVSFLDKNC